MIDTNALTAANTRRWANAKLTRNFTGLAKSLVAAKSRYQAVEAKTGVPWSVIAVIHERESSQDWMASLAQGDPWNRMSIHVPSGRGPFRSWEDAAVDALVNCAPFLGRKKDWSLGPALTDLELYNGAGYANRGVASPYLWAGTDQYRSGKFVRDGVYDSNVSDVQPGCAGLLKTMMQFDPSISFGDLTGEKVAPAPKPAPVPKPSPPRKPSFTSPTKGSVGAFFVELFRSLTGRK